MCGTGWRRRSRGDDPVESAIYLATTLNILRRMYQKSHAVRVIVPCCCDFQTITDIEAVRCTLISEIAHQLDLRLHCRIT
jgi:hypothetical protein